MLYLHDIFKDCYTYLSGLSLWRVILTMQALYAQIGTGISKYFKLYKCLKHIM